MPDSAVRCDRCDATIDAKNIVAGLACCSACGLVFDLVRVPRSGRTERLRAVARRPVANRRLAIPLPDGVELEFDEPAPPVAPELTSHVPSPGGTSMMPYRQAALRLDDDHRHLRADAKLRMSVPAGNVLGFQTTAILTFAGVLFLVVGAMGLMSRTGAPWFLAFVGGGLLVIAAWHYLAMRLNRVTITLEGSWLTIRVGPIPMGGNKRIEATNIEQVWTRMTMNKVAGPKHGEPDLVRAYNVELRRKFGKPIVLVRDLDQQDQALFIEQRLEQALGIIDVEVAEESRTDPNDA